MSLKKSVAYFGDGTIGGAASYLSGVMKHYEIPFERIDSGSAPPEGFFDEPRALYVLSDYPRSGFRHGDLEKLSRNVEQFGSGLLMIGGWESFHGRLGEYHRTCLADVLPVIMAESDDRQNWPIPALLRTVCSHEIVDELPWNNPPGVGGYNRFTLKKDAKLILEGVRVEVHVLGADVDEQIVDAEHSAGGSGSGYIPKRRILIPLVDGDAICVRIVDQVPMLAIGHYGEGRTAAFASDVAPHWVGGFVDWGPSRVTEPIGAEGEFIEVGENYAKFWRNLVNWTARFI